MDFFNQRVFDIAGVKSIEVRHLTMCSQTLTTGSIKSSQIGGSAEVMAVKSITTVTKQSPVKKQGKQGGKTLKGEQQANI